MSITLEIYCHKFRMFVTGLLYIIHYKVSLLYLHTKFKNKLSEQWLNPVLQFINNWIFKIFQFLVKKNIYFFGNKYTLKMKLSLEKALVHST